jgi:hypothetical protein
LIRYTARTGEFYEVNIELYDDRADSLATAKRLVVHRAQEVVLDGSWVILLTDETATGSVDRIIYPAHQIVSMGVTRLGDAPYPTAAELVDAHTRVVNAAGETVVETITE